MKRTGRGLKVRCVAGRGRRKSDATLNFPIRNPRVESLCVDYTVCGNSTDFRPRRRPSPMLWGVQGCEPCCMRQTHETERGTFGGARPVP